MVLRSIKAREIGNLKILSLKEELIILKNSEKIKEENEEENMYFSITMLMTDVIRNVKFVMIFAEVPLNNNNLISKKLWLWTNGENCGFFDMENFDAKEYITIFNDKFFNVMKNFNIKMNASIVCIIENDLPFVSNEKVKNFYKKHWKHGIYRFILPGNLQLNTNLIKEDFVLLYNEENNVRNSMYNKNQKNNSINILEVWKKLHLA